MARSIRRVVTGHDDQGRAVCISDGIATNVLQRPNRPGVTLTNLWRNERTPTEYDGATETVAGPFVLHPPKGGAVFRIVEFEPEDPEVLRNVGLFEIELLADVGDAPTLAVEQLQDPYACWMSQRFEVFGLNRSFLIHVHLSPS